MPERNFMCRFFPRRKRSDDIFNFFAMSLRRELRSCQRPRPKTELLIAGSRNNLELMRRVITLALLLGLACAVRAIAQEQAQWEKITDVSPNKKFAMRVSCKSEPADPAEIDPESVTAVDLVSLPSKTVVAGLGKSMEGAPPQKLLWSQDSRWFAFALSQGHRVTETSVYHQTGDKFEPIDTEKLGVSPGGDARNQYIEPVRWLKPGTLVLKQFTIFFYGKGESTFEFTVRFQENGKFQVVSKKKVRNKDE
jgi:hypothetical protein